MAAARGKRRTASSSLAAAIKPRLRLAKAAARKQRLAELREAAAAAGMAKKLDAIFDKHEKLAPFVTSVLDYAPFLRTLILSDPERLIALLSAEPSASLEHTVAEAADAWRSDSREEVMTALRGARQSVALLVALADLGGIWDVVAVTGALTRLRRRRGRCCCQVRARRGSTGGTHRLA